jgi:UDP-glucose 4-epimerase
MQVLVTGGAGYIGSVTVDLLINKGIDVIVVDNLSTGRREAFGEEIPFYQYNCGDRAKLQHIFTEHKIDVVMHFAASALVGESVANPALYFQNNVIETQNLLDTMRKFHCQRFILSSSAATFGEPEYSPIDENHPQNPTNPYGLTKMINEKTLAWYHHAYGLMYNVFRYFNAAGATETHGEKREIETHIIPLAIHAAEGNHKFRLYGNDYPTADGTCVRDYVHVSDLAEAHILGIGNLELNPGGCYNLGNGDGFSNLRVVEAVKKVTGSDFEFSYGPRREGDPATLVASSEKAKTELGWTPQFWDLEKIVDSAYKFYKKMSTNSTDK